MGSSKEIFNGSKYNYVNNKAMLQEEFSALTKLGNSFRIRHHETDKKDIGCNEHYDYLFHRCLSVLKLATSVLSEVKPDEV